MSGNTTNKQNTGRVVYAGSKALAKRINFDISVKRLFRIILFDVFLASALTAVWCLITEYQAGVAFSWKLSRFFTWNVYPNVFDTLGSFIYHFGGRAVEVGTFALAVAGALAVTFILQLINWLNSCLFGSIPIRKRLKSIDAIASAANRLSRGSFDEGKFRNLQDAIDHINTATPDAKLNIGDENLAGLESAVNNLIKRMHESYRQQIRFVDDASHELRTPIAVIQGYANMLDRWGKNDEKILDESIGAIKTEAEHMKVLVEQLLFLARGDMGRQNFTPEKLSLAEMLGEIHDESEMIDSKHDYRLSAEEDIKVDADPAMLKQSVRILVDNAAKYTPEGGIISLRLQKGTKNDACIVVQDNGVGISAGDLEHIFERFYRSDKARNSSTGGSGLGLAIAKWIVERHEGWFSVVSREGAGTRITIHLPLPQEAKTPL
jgi:signal transduction histidine kinase